MNAQAGRHEDRRKTGGGAKIGRIFGIEIRLDLSVAIIFFLVVYSLGTGVIPEWHEDWDAIRIWATALAAGLLFFTSLLAHELAHSLVAQLRGIPVPRITLFVFGGMSEMEREPDTPVSEFLIAIVGPITSFVLGGIFTRVGLSLAGESFMDQILSDPESAMASLGPAATLLLWLGPVNLVLAVFNLVPGFPLDGGRVLRATVWWMTGDLERATRLATNAGRGFAWGLMGLGFLQLLHGGLIGGLWLILIGWFLQIAAKGSQVQLMLRQALEGLSVRDLMRTRFEAVEPNLSVDLFLEQYLLRSGQPAWPVVDGEHLIGMVSLNEVREARQQGHAGLTVQDVMRPITEYVLPQVAGRDALQILVSSALDPLPVVEDARIVGLLYRADIMRWLAVYQLKAGAH
jgi:Zn-dependent protease/CBS domain-containing protein